MTSLLVLIELCIYLIFKDDEDGNVISCSMSVSRRNVIANVLSDMEDRLLATEHISNPNNKCLPLRTKGRIHEMASKKGRRHIRLEIGKRIILRLLLEKKMNEFLSIFTIFFQIFQTKRRVTSN